jgi:hypothetical protein
LKKVSFKFDPYELVGLDRPGSGEREARHDIADFILEEVLNSVGAGKSPVSGGQWKRTLSPEYKKKKAAISSALFANMELQGDMLDALECVLTKDGMLELRIAGDQAPKADGHNNHSGKSSLPAREFIPKADQTFKRDILAGVKSIALEHFEKSGKEKP